MKNAILPLLSAGLLILFACNSSTNKVAGSDSLNTDLDEHLERQCYRAVDGKDTAFLNLNTTMNGKVTGDLVINYSTNPKNSGTIEGKFVGDTLFVDYSFTTGTYEKQVNKNPMAFLKTGDRLTVGIGVIETTMGKSYFVKDKPIDFERGRFKFDPIDCAN